MQIQSELGQTGYDYDPLNRLSKADPDQALQTLGLPQEAYSYDAAGNRLSSAHQAGAWAYNADNQMTQYPATTPFERNPGVETQVSYTAQGHTQKESNALESKEYEYNAAERLIRYASTEQGQSGPQIEASYRHDPFGRRIAKTVRQGQNSRTTYYIYSEQGLMAEADEKGQMTKAYGFNPTTMQLGLWSTDPVWQAETPGGSLTAPKARYDWLHTDHLGTPILATTKEGQTSWKAVSESFGATLPIDQDIEMNLRFPGQYFDAETGTYYNFHRDYRPNAGRYLQSDPIGLEGGLNLFGYVDANPIFNTDSTGEYWQAPVLFCLRFPRICQSIIKCFKNPVSCRRKFCLAGNRLYHPMCDFPGCVVKESCPTTYMKLVLAEGCYMNRLAVQWFCGKKTDPEHENEKAIAWKKGQECLALVAVNCEECR